MRWSATKRHEIGMWYSIAASALVLIDGQAVGQCELAKLLASDGATEDYFGLSVSISGSPGNEVAILGASRTGDSGTFSGSAYIYRFNSDMSGWVEVQKLLTSDGMAGDGFGYSVSICGESGNEVAIIGANGDDDNGSASGSAYIYRFNPETLTWDEEAKLLPSDGIAGDWFGYSVSISGTSGYEIAIVGAYRHSDSAAASGSAYIYRFNGVNWVQEAKLLASDGAYRDYFGWSVSISGIPGNEVAIVGAIEDFVGTDSGYVYIYRFNGVNWIEEQKLLASDGAAGDNFGGSVSISVAPGNEVAIVGAYLEGDTLDDKDSGAAYIYRFDSDTSVWVEEQKLIASDGAVFDWFGHSVSISGVPGYEVAIVGAWGNDDNGQTSGSAYIYRFNPDMSGWVQKQKLLASDGAVDEKFGLSVSIIGTPGNEVAIIGANNDDDNGFRSGSAYVYGKSIFVCPGDILGCDGMVGVFDLLALLGAWGPCPANPTPCPSDSNNDGNVNVTDLLTVLAAWGPCP